MLDILFGSQFTATTHFQAKRSNLIWGSWFLILLGATGLLGAIMFKFGPSPVLIAWLLFGLAVALVTYQPRYGVYLILFLSLVGDTTLEPWYPFLKNFSSRESIFFIQDSLIISPMEFFIIYTFLVWLIRGGIQRQTKIFLGELFWPAAVFIGFIIFGMVYGLGRGGNLNIGLWEARPIFYLFLMLILTSNLITRREHVNHLMWLIMLAIFIEGVIGIIEYFAQYHGDLSGVNSIVEHSAAVQMNTLFIFIIAAWFYHASAPKRLILPMMAPFVLFTYLVAQRRAAFLTLIIALGLILVLTYVEKRRLFWLIAPPLVTVSLIYTALFWNSTGTLGQPAQAIKSMVDQSQASLEDQLSNQYRVLENINASFTIHQDPLTGVGFGNKFHIIVTLPDISTFTWWEYITHNSIVWIWMKTGVFGFLSLLFMISFTVWTGMNNLFRMPAGDMRAIALVAVLYVIMHFVYAYVDMSWDTQSMLYIGTAMGLINCLPRIVSVPLPATIKRWPWQPDPKPIAESVPLDW